MIWPPSLLRLRFARRGRTLRLWLPLFLLWPVLLILAVVLTPLVLFVALCCGRRGRWVAPALPLAAVAVCSLRGLSVDIEQNQSDSLRLEFR